MFVGGKKGNHKRTRKFLGFKGPRPDLKELRRQEATERQAAYDNLSTAEKLERLKLKISTGKHGEAKKQLKKLTKQLEEKPLAPKPTKKS